MNLALWIAAGLVAAVMVAGSTSNLFVPKEKSAVVVRADLVETP